jgi:hypothetical protein
MGALNQLGSGFSNIGSSISNAVSSIGQPIEQAISKPLAQLDKDLSLSQNAPLIAAATAAYLSGGLVGGETLAGAGAAGAGATAADLAAYDAIAGLTAGGAGAGAGLAGAGLAGAATGAFDAGIGLDAMIGGAGAAPQMAAGGAGLLTSAMNFAKENPNLALAGAGLAAKALGGSSTPSSSTSSTSIDPDIKAAYLQQLADARTAAAGLGTRQFEGFTPGYATAEQQLTATGIGGAGQQTTNQAAQLALREAGYTPQQIQAMTGAQYMSAYQNPYEQQVVQNTLADIERQRQIAQQAQQARAVGARAFGGSRQAISESLANEDYTRRMADTAAQLRSAGFTTAAGFGQTDAARAMEAARANAANQIAGAGIRQTAVGQLGALGAQQQNLGMTGAQAVMTAEQQRQQLAQARLDAARNLASERLGLTGSALGQNVPNLGGTTTTPIFRNQTASALGGALGGAQLGSILGGAGNPQYAGYGAILGGLLGLG